MSTCGCCCINRRHSKLRSHHPQQHVQNESMSENDNINTLIQNDSVGGYIDEYGFVVTEDEKKAKMTEIGSHQHRNVIRKLNQRTQKWLHMLNDWDTYTTLKKPKLKSRIRKGIPTPLRAKIIPKDEFKLAIDNDIDRTFPRHVLFTSSEGHGKDSLRNMLYAYSNHDEEVGYAQGMGCIAALFLMLMTEEEAFCCLCRLLDQNGEYQLRELYLDGLPLLNCRYYQFDQLLLKFMPKVHQKIASLEITPAFYASTWFITIFCYQFPFNFVYRIWDIYLFEGIKVVFRVGLALIKMNEDAILRIDTFGEMMEYLQHLHTQKEQIMNADELLNTAFDLALKREHLEQIQLKYNQQRLAQQRMDGRANNKGRDVSEMEPTIFLKQISETQQELQDNINEELIISNNMT
eukprot:108595_1